MNTDTTSVTNHRARWAAIGAAVAVSLGAGGIGIVQATSPDGASAYVPITPCRLADTRPAPNNVGPKSSPLGAGDTHTFNGWASAGGTGDCDTTALPDGTTGLELNVTAVGPTQNTNLRFWPTGDPMPLSSNLNPSVGQPATPNSVSVTLSPTGQFDVFNFQGEVDVAIDVVGHYTDHNHDDRYYTKNQTDAALAELHDDAWGYVVASSAGFHASSGNVEATKVGTGEYCLVVSDRFSHKAAQVTLADPGGSKIVSVGTGHGSNCNPLMEDGVSVIPVYVVDTVGTAVDGNFVFYIPPA